MTLAVQSAFVADADTVPVVMLAVSPDLLDWSAAVNLSVAGDVEVIPDVAEAPVSDVVPATLFKIKALPLGGGRAMNDN